MLIGDVTANRSRQRNPEVYRTILSAHIQPDATFCESNPTLLEGTEIEYSLVARSLT